jgi:predicted phosphodiesterase
MKVAVLTDVHANLPALDAALSAIADAGCHAIYHTGDAIGIGPFPAECLARLLATPGMRLIMGNHDAWFAFGLPQPQPTWMSDGEMAHQQWTHAQLDPALRPVVAAWPYVVQDVWDGVRVTLLHYALDGSGREFIPIVREPTSVNLDRIFAPYQSHIVFYGHHHPASDLRGQQRYVNPGSLGCHRQAVARFTILNCGNGSYTLEHHAVPYDDTSLFAEIDRRQVPERDFICRVFFARDM